MLNQEQFYQPKLRVLALSPALLPGGAEQQLTTLVKHAQRVQYAGLITIAAQHYAPPILASAVAYYCPFYANNCHEGENATQAAIRSVREFSGRYDVIMYWGFGSIDLKFTGVPVIHVSHASGVERANANDWQFMMQAGQSQAEFQVAVSRSGVPSFAPEVRQKTGIHVIHNGSDVERTRPVNGREWQRKLWGLRDNDVVMLYMGRFYKGKGPEVALKSLKYLPENYKLVLHGWGEQGAALREIARQFPNRVIFPQPRFWGLGDVYAAADVVVIPSSSEAFPLVMVEAWQACVPLVCSEFATLSECEELYAKGQSLAWHIPCPPSPKDVANGVLSIDATDERVMRAMQVGFTDLTASAMVGRWETFFYEAVRQWHELGRYGSSELITDEADSDDDPGESSKVASGNAGSGP